MPFLILIFFLFLSPLVYAQYSLYPGECLHFATNLRSYEFCIPPNASANQTFNFTYEYLVHVQERTRTKKVTEEVYIPQYYENTTRLEELNRTVKNLRILYRYYSNLSKKLMTKLRTAESERDAYKQLADYLQKKLENINATVEELEGLVERLKESQRTQFQVFTTIIGTLIFFLAVLFFKGVKIRKVI